MFLNNLTMTATPNREKTQTAAKFIVVSTGAAGDRTGFTQNCLLFGTIEKWNGLESDTKSRRSIMKTLPTVWTALFALLLVGCAHQRSSDTALKYSSAVSFVLVPADATTVHRLLADRLAIAFGAPSAQVCNDKRNKGCCTWVEITDQTTTPGPIYQGYLIVHLPEGAAFISSSSEEQLELAILRIVRSSRKHHTTPEERHRESEAARMGSTRPEQSLIDFPVGLMTNYELPGE
jgi:hypothetical protein